MAVVRKRYVFEFDPDEISLLLKLTGRESSASIVELGMEPEVHDRVYNALTTAAYQPMREDAP